MNNTDETDYGYIIFNKRCNNTLDNLRKFNRRKGFKVGGLIKLKDARLKLINKFKYKK